uniref:protein-serine/threonine phosphatase n=1 Tax=Wollemia nobilis TaxID=56998 RepID=A0A0C9S3G9_9CONI
MGCINGKCMWGQQPSSSNSPHRARIGREGNDKGHRTVEVARVPAFNYQLKYSYMSQRGYYPDALDKANQDSLCVHISFADNPNDHFFGVFDGHGQYGTQCSQFVEKKLCENLAQDPHLERDIVRAYHSAFRLTNEQLHSDRSIEDSLSGTTAITVLVRGRTLYVANVGDSRAVIAERRAEGVVAVDLSSDQTPFRADEYDRVRECGARVLSLDQLEGLKDPSIRRWGRARARGSRTGRFNRSHCEEEDDDEEGQDEDEDGGDPPRLWLPNANYPGTAFTRSLGDSTAEGIGVIAVPEVTVMDLTPSHPFFVIASDGVFEFLSSQAVVDMVVKFKNPCDACAAIVSESHRLWLENETRTDDITIIIVQIDGLHDAG